MEQQPTSMRGNKKKQPKEDNGYKFDYQGIILVQLPHEASRSP